jgi:hypothetical protein
MLQTTAVRAACPTVTAGVGSCMCMPRAVLALTRTTMFTSKAFKVNLFNHCKIKTSPTSHQGRRSASRRRKGSPHCAYGVQRCDSGNSATRLSFLCYHRSTPTIKYPTTPPHQPMQYVGATSCSCPLCAAQSVRLTYAFATYYISIISCIVRPAPPP